VPFGPYKKGFVLDDKFKVLPVGASGASI